MYDILFLYLSFPFIPEFMFIAWLVNDLCGRTVLDMLKLKLSLCVSQLLFFSGILTASMKTQSLLWELKQTS